MFEEVGDVGLRELVLGVLHAEGPVFDFAVIIAAILRVIRRQFTPLAGIDEELAPAFLENVAPWNFHITLIVVG